MRLAWFRPDLPGAPSPCGLDDVVAALAEYHEVTLVPEGSAHDFVWRHARGHFDLPVYELDNTARHAYMWPYLVHYPGVVVLTTASLHDSRRARLVHEGRQADYRTEIAFAGGPTHTAPPWHLAKGRWPMLRVPVEASRLAVVLDEHLAEALSDRYGKDRVRYVAPAVAAPHERATASDTRVRLVIVEPDRRAVVERALQRVDGPGLSLLPTDQWMDAHIVVANRWPLQGRPLVAALRAFAQGQAVVVTDTHGTAAWPTLDPQTWRVRGTTDAQAVAVSVDPRDEEHSLVVALRRLADDPQLRATLGAAANSWWLRYGTVDSAVSAWRQALEDAAGRTTWGRPQGWPAHLVADGSALADAILRECGVEADWR